MVAAKLQIKSASDDTALLMLGASGPAIQANLTDIPIVAVGNLMLHRSFLSLPHVFPSSVILLHPPSSPPELSSVSPPRWL